MKINIIPNSKEGFLRKSTCFSNNALLKANATPIPAEARNVREKLLIPCMKSDFSGSRSPSSLLSCKIVLKKNYYKFNNCDYDYLHTYLIEDFYLFCLRCKYN